MKNWKCFWQKREMSITWEAPHLQLHLKTCDISTTQTQLYISTTLKWWRGFQTMRLQKELIKKSSSNRRFYIRKEKYLFSMFKVETFGLVVSSFFKLFRHLPMLSVGPVGLLSILINSSNTIHISLSSRFRVQPKFRLWRWIMKDSEIEMT